MEYKTKVANLIRAADLLAVLTNKLYYSGKKEKLEELHILLQSGKNLQDFAGLCARVQELRRELLELEFQLERLRDSARRESDEFLKELGTQEVKVSCDGRLYTFAFGCPPTVSESPDESKG